MTLLGGMGTIFGPVVGAFVDHRRCENYLAGFGAVGDRHHRRHLRRLRARVPPRHRGRARRVVGRAARLISALAGSRRCSRRRRRGRATAAWIVDGSCRDGLPHGRYELRDASGSCASSARSTTASAPARSSSGRRTARASRTMSVRRRSRCQRHGRALVPEAAPARAAARARGRLCARGERRRPTRSWYPGRPPARGISSTRAARSERGWSDPGTLRAQAHERRRARRRPA